MKNFFLGYWTTTFFERIFHSKSDWMVIREYAKTKPDVVWEYVQNNELAPLSRREAIKHIKENYGINNEK